MSCNNSTFQTIKSLTAYADSGIVWSYPFNALAAQTPYVVKGTHYTLPTYTPVTIPFSSADVEDSSKENRAGRLYKVVVKWTMEPETEDGLDINALLSTLRTPHHLLIEYYGGAQEWVRMCDGTIGYKFQWYRKDGKFQCEIDIANLSGRQIVK